jgi:hypothetical protein
MHDTDRCRIPFNLWRADHWYTKPTKGSIRRSKEDYTYYFKHNVSVTTSGFFSTRGLEFCIKEIGLDRCMYSIGERFVGIRLRARRLEIEANDPRLPVRLHQRGARLVEKRGSARETERGRRAWQRDQALQASFASIDRKCLDRLTGLAESQLPVTFFGNVIVICLFAT